MAYASLAGNLPYLKFCFFFFDKYYKPLRGYVYCTLIEASSSAD